MSFSHKIFCNNPGIKDEGLRFLSPKLLLFLLYVLLAPAARQLMMTRKIHHFFSYYMKKLALYSNGVGDCLYQNKCVCITAPLGSRLVGVSSLSVYYDLLQNNNKLLSSLGLKTS